MGRSTTLNEAELVVEAGSESGNPLMLRLRSSGTTEVLISAPLAWNKWHCVVLARFANGFARLTLDGKEVPDSKAHKEKDTETEGSTVRPTLSTIETAFRLFGSKRAEELSKGSFLRFVLFCRESLEASPLQVLLSKKKKWMKAIQPPPLVLQKLKLLKKQAHPVFQDASFFGCFCDAFISAGQQPQEVIRSHRLVLFALETLMKESAHHTSCGISRDLLQKTYEQLLRSSKLFEKIDLLWAVSEPDIDEQVPLVKNFLKVLNELR